MREEVRATLRRGAVPRTLLFLCFKELAVTVTEYCCLLQCFFAASLATTVAVALSRAECSLLTSFGKKSIAALRTARFAPQLPSLEALP
jgi:hypothetical protein